MRWDVLLERRCLKRLNPDSSRKHLRRIAEAGGRNRALGFVGRVGPLGEPELVVDPSTGEEVYRYSVFLRLEKMVLQDAEAARRQFEHVLRVVRRCARGQGWDVVEHTEQGEATPVWGQARDDRPAFEVPALTPEVMATYFRGVYERDEHIRIIHDAVVNHVATLAAWRRDNSLEVARSHVLLKGKPAGAKTMLFERLKRWYEQVSPGAERVTFVDTPTASKAGIENWLLDKAEQGELADIVVFEELEKLQPLDNLLPLVSVMGSGHIAKLNARVGLRRQLANVLVWATCNDEKVIRRWRNGALWSRFSKKLHCPRPSRELMRRILLDTVARLGGNPAWADKALEFAFEVMPAVIGHSMDDPRELKGLLDGRDRLLDGSYQADLLNILWTEKKEAKADRRKEPAGVER